MSQVFARAVALVLERYEGPEWEALPNTQRSRLLYEQMRIIDEAESAQRWSDTVQPFGDMGQAH